MMRIGYQIKCFDPARGGAEMYTWRMCQQLAQRGLDVHVFTRSASGAPAGVSVHVVEPFDAQTVLAAVKSQGIEVFVGGSDSLGMNVFQPHGGTMPRVHQQNLAMIRSGAGRQLRALWNRLAARPRKQLAAAKRQYDQTDPRPHFLAISRMVRDDMQRFYGLPADHLHVVYNGIDTATFSPEKRLALRVETRAAWQVPEEAVCFAEVAHNFRLKGVRELLEAIGRLGPAKNNLRLLVAGRGNASPYLRLARRMGCAEQVTFIGPISDVLRVYAAADVYVHPTWYDPCSLVVLEAWACGLPVITSRFNGAGELMTPGQEGFLIDSPRQTDQLAEHMTQLLDRDLRQRMGAAARVLAQQHTMERHLSEILRVFELAIGRGTQTLPAVGEARDSVRLEKSL